MQSRPTPVGRHLRRVAAWSAGREHSKVDKAALLEVEAIVAAGGTPQYSLRTGRAGEIVGIAESPINILVPEHLARAH
ncbi:hypothetical protein HFO94_24870 [Rhizobium leguminosarum]|nr:hypothetical protein [Rhizobium leguminosarum]